MNKLRRNYKSVERLPRIEIWPLLHERAHGEPEAVGEGEVVLDDKPGVHAGVRGGPLGGREPGHDPDGEGDHQVSQHYVDPYVQGQGVHETK